MDPTWTQYALTVLLGLAAVALAAAGWAVADRISTPKPADEPNRARRWLHAEAAWLGGNHPAQTWHLAAAVRRWRAAEKPVERPAEPAGSRDTEEDRVGCESPSQPPGTGCSASTRVVSGVPCLICGAGRSWPWLSDSQVGPCTACSDGPYQCTPDGLVLARAGDGVCPHGRS